MSNRTLVIGDIHGAYRALIQVLERAKVTVGDHLIFLGDYVDGWSESAEVVQLLIELDRKQSCTFIKGNHDVWALEWLKNGEADPIWVQHGGASTIQGYKSVKKDDLVTHKAFLEQLVNYYVDEENRLFIHAGFSSMHGPEREFYQSNYTWDRTLWEMAVAMDKNIKNDSSSFPKRLKLFKEIYIGHTPTLYWGTNEPMQRANVWNLDTGAAFTGKLTIMDIKTRTYWQSDTVQSLYPKETGRN